MGVAWARGWQRAGQSVQCWVRQRTSRQACGTLAAGQEVEGTWGLARTAERGSDGSSALLAAPGQITSSLLGRPLRAPRTREGDGAKLCQAGTVWGAVRTRGRGAGGSAPPSPGLLCREQLRLQVSGVPGSAALPGLHIRPLEKLKRPRSLGPSWGRAGAHWEGSDCCPGEPDVQPGGARRSPGGLAVGSTRPTRGAWVGPGLRISPHSQRHRGCTA